MTLLEKLAGLKEQVAKIQAENEGVESVWFTFRDVPLAELYEVADTYKEKPTFEQPQDKLRLHLPSEKIGGYHITCFLWSKKVECVDKVNVFTDFREVEDESDNHG